MSTSDSVSSMESERTTITTAKQKSKTFSPIEAKPGAIESPKDIDILLGRGKFVNNHPGNVGFRELVLRHKVQYVVSPKYGKPDFAKKIVLELQSRGARFLKQDGIYWYEINFKQALLKTRQALREGAPEITEKVVQGRPDAKRSEQPTDPLKGEKKQKQLQEVDSPTESSISFSTVSDFVLRKVQQQQREQFVWPASPQQLLAFSPPPQQQPLPLSGTLNPYSDILGFRPSGFTGPLISPASPAALYGSPTPSLNLDPGSFHSLSSPFLQLDWVGLDYAQPPSSVLSRACSIPTGSSALRAFAPFRLQPDAGILSNGAEQVTFGTDRK